MRKYIERITALTIGVVAGILIGRFVMPRPTVPPPLTDKAFEERTKLILQLEDVIRRTMIQHDEAEEYNKEALRPPPEEKIQKKGGDKE